jgi:hypothetical protein
MFRYDGRVVNDAYLVREGYDFLDKFLGNALMLSGWVSLKKDLVMPVISDKMADPQFQQRILQAGGLLKPTLRCSVP